MIVRLNEIPDALVPHALHAVGEAFQCRMAIGDVALITVNDSPFGVERLRKSWRVSIAVRTPVPVPKRSEPRAVA